MRACNRWFVVLVLSGVVSACASESSSDSGSDADVSDDPRCNALCSVEAPPVEDAFAVCSADSLEQCGELCEVRIAGQTSLCAECLLEDAWLPTPSQFVGEHCLEDDTCYVGLTRWCDDGCWLSENSGECGSDVDCSDAMVRAEYDEQVADGTACSFEREAEEARADCLRQIHPREEVTCEVVFESVSECADVCGPGH